MKKITLYNDSLGQFSRDFFSKNDPRYDRGTSGSTIQEILMKLPWKPFGEHIEEMGYMNTFYYLKEPQGIPIKVIKGVCDVVIEAYLSTNSDLESVVTNLREEFNSLRVQN